MQIEKDQPITTVEELQSVIKEITMENTSLDFKWRFISEPVADQGWFVQVEFQRPDTSTGEIGTGRSRKEFVAKGTWVSGVVKTCWLLLELTIRQIPSSCLRELETTETFVRVGLRSRNRKRKNRH